MAQDSVFNATAVVRLQTGENLANWDIHVNVVGGGRIDGPSAGVAVVMALALSWDGRFAKMWRDGEVSIRIRQARGRDLRSSSAPNGRVVRAVIQRDNLAEIPDDVPGRSSPYLTWRMCCRYSSR